MTLVHQRDHMLKRFICVAGFFLSKCHLQWTLADFLHFNDKPSMVAGQRFNRKSIVEDNILGLFPLIMVEQLLLCLSVPIFSFRGVGNFEDLLGPNPLQMFLVSNFLYIYYFSIHLYIYRMFYMVTSIACSCIWALFWNLWHFLLYYFCSTHSVMETAPLHWSSIFLAEWTLT